MKWTHNKKAPPGKKLLAALAVACALTVPASAVLAAPILGPDAEYSVQYLDANPAGHAWGNVIPNALAGYYTYQPLSHADAVAIGFQDFTDPVTGLQSCGNKTLTGSPADVASTNDCYIITAKRFTQPMGLEPLHSFFTGWGMGLLGANDTYFTTPQWTDVFGYGSGGKNWTPPQFKFTTVSAAHPGGIRPWDTNIDGPLVTIQGNAPAPLFNSAIGDTVTTPVVQEGIWHFPAPTIKGTKGRPVRVQWLNELPNKIIPGFDPTVDSGDTVPNGFPYNRMVVHVHGAHVGPESDGLAHGGFNPDFSNVGYKFNQTVLQNPLYRNSNPPGTYYYPMDQEASTIWYHDHAIAATHTNTNQGLAGFFPITDAHEQSLIAAGTLPNPALTDSGGLSGFDLGFALQDRIFGIDGQFKMPDAPVIDGKFPSCDPTDAGTRLATCSPLFMFASHVADLSSNTPAGIHMVPYNEFTMENIPENLHPVTGAPFLATSATLEFFGNMPVVNGSVYGKYPVDPTVYRMRFIGGTDSRTWLMGLKEYTSAGVFVKDVPWYQIGSEQGLLPTPVKRMHMLLMGGERLDAIVDFTGMPAGNYVMMTNLGPDAPFQGEDLLNLPGSLNQSKWIPEIMKFVITAGGDTNPALKPSANEAAYLATPLNTMAALTPNAHRVVALEEIVDEYERIMPTIDRRGYDLPGMQTTEVVLQHAIEQWDIVNTTADAHPMHLHQVAFQLIDRVPLATFTPATNDIVTGVFSPASYTVDATLPNFPSEPHDFGWKDTIFTPPGYVTRVKALFDLVGEYVWHCHILSHEEHDMMRPLTVVPTALTAPTALSVPAAALNNRDASITITPATNPGTTKYYVEYKKVAPTVDANWTTNANSSQLAQTITFPSDGVYQVRAKAVDAAQYPAYADSVYTAESTITVAPSDQITSPVTTLGGANQTFTFTTSGAYPHYLWLGSTGAGSSNLGRYTAASGVSSINATGLPVNGSTVYARLWVKVGTGHMAEMRYRDYTFTAVNIAGAAIATPAPGVLTSDTQTFTWADIGASKYQLRIGSTVNGYEYKIVTVGAGSTSVTVTGLPVNSAALKVTLLSLVGTTWVSNHYDYTAAGPAAISTPAPGVLTSGSVTFNWNNVGAVKYQLRIGSTPGAYDYGIVTVGAGTTSATINGLPLTSAALKVTLMSQLGSTWASNSYDYTSAGPAAISTPTSGVLTSNSVTFSWNNAGASKYQLRIGSTPGAYDYGIVTVGAGTTNATINNLPLNGSLLKVTLMSLFGTTWVSSSYDYTAASPAALSLPAAASVIGTSQLFQWNNVGAANYQVRVGTAIGDYTYGIKTVGAGTTSTTLTGLPTGSLPLVITLYSKFGTVWVPTSISVTSAM